MKKTTEYRLPFTDMGTPESFELRKRLVELARHLEMIAMYERQRPNSIHISWAPATEDIPQGWRMEIEL